MFMKKISASSVALLTMLFFLSAARPLPAMSVNFYGLSVEIPDGWSFRQGEQVLIYNQNESAAVIVDQAATTQSGTVKSVAENLADAVGVKKNDIRRDKKGSLRLDFVQNGEPVNVRVLESRGRILMVYVFGKDSEANDIAASIGEKSAAGH
ncbi:hypothetical protein HMPREF7215_1369 [Pyramidobacter piscolens W5455]|uniref:Uncharacterized protein n=2 Tax=Pyramidobacter piscolens TaxID=638849 RepID=A0ABM9ZYG4_9BACT|nr:hypothetical protein HMPREF7215_1369 [Pyramidobacter piscolens W5455]